MEEVIHLMSRNREGIPLRYEDLWKEEGNEINIKPEQELKETTNWWTYYQYKNLFRQDENTYGFRRDLSELEQILIGENQKVISKLYKWLLRWETIEEQIKSQMIKWAINVNADIELENWEYWWKEALKISACSAIHKNCYKLIYRWHLTPKKLAKIYKRTSNRCWKCSHAEVSYYHQWWTCPKIRKYWRDIHREIQKILKRKIPLRPELFLS